MGIISGTGVFSGIDTAKIIDQLLAVERKPIDVLNKKKSDYNTKISKWGNVSNAITNLKNTLEGLKSGNILTNKALSSNTNILTASASSNAVIGSYDINVIKLAESQSIYSNSYTSINDPVADLNSNPIQKISIKLGNGNEKIITIDSTNNSLISLKDAINSSGLDIRASIINDGNGYRLAINSLETGADNRIVIKVDENNDGVFESSPDEMDNNGLSQLAFNPTYDPDGNITGGIANMIQSRKALNSLLEINGMTVERSKNDISDLIDGVTIKLLNVSNGEKVKLSIDKDYSSAISKINSFVSNYNNLMNMLKDETLKNDPIAKQIMGSIRSIITGNYNNQTLTNFGLNHDKNGVLGLDSAKMENFLKNNFSEASEVFNSMVSSMDINLKNFLEKVIPSRKENYNKFIENIDKKIAGMEDKLSKLEMDYRRRFFELEKTIAGLQKSGDYLTQTLSKWEKK